MRKANNRISFVYDKLQVLVVALLFILIAGCQDPAVTWSAEEKSPDGLWLVSAQSQQWGGPGTAYDATTVYLKWVKGRQPPVEILGFSHQYATMHLEMKWVTPKHLAVTYAPTSKPGDHVSVDFQAIKCADVTISVEEVPSKTFDASQARN